MLMIIVTATFITIVLLVLGLTLRSEQAIMRERIRAHAQGAEAAGPSVEQEMALPFGQRILLPFLRKIAGFAERFTSSGALRNAGERLETAGRPLGLGALEFVGLRVLSIIGLVAVGLFAMRFLQVSFLLKVAAFGLVAFIGFILPDYLLNRTISERQAQIRRALPDTLDLLTVSVEAGLGLDAAMQKVVEKLKGPLTDELRFALQEMRIGKMRLDALRGAAKRAKVPELTSFVAAVYQADQLGVPISKVLRVQSASLRSQRAQRARETAAKLPIKMLFPLVFFIFPALFIVTLGPGVIQTGKAMGFIQ
jgi:tight adherence protein C